MWFLKLIALILRQIADHDGNCSGNENEEEEDMLVSTVSLCPEDKLSILLVQICMDNPNMLRWVLPYINVAIDNSDWPAGSGSGCCGDSPSGLQHARAARVLVNHSLSLSERFDPSPTDCMCEAYVRYAKDHMDGHVTLLESAFTETPEHIRLQMYEFLMCIKRLDLTLCPDMRRRIFRLLIEDWRMLLTL